MASNRPETAQSSASLQPEDPYQSKLAGDAAEASNVAAKEQAPEEVSKATKTLVLTSVFLFMFLVALDRTIIATVRRPESLARFIRPVISARRANTNRLISLTRPFPQ